MVDADLQITGGRARSSRSWDCGGGGGGGLQKIFFRPFGPRFGLKIEEGAGPRAPTLDPPLLLASLQLKFDHVTTYFGPILELHANLSHEINFLHAHSHLDYLRWRQQFSSPEPAFKHGKIHLPWAEIRDSQRSICGLMPVFDFFQNIGTKMIKLLLIKVKNQALKYILYL